MTEKFQWDLEKRIAILEAQLDYERQRANILESYVLQLKGLLAQDEKQKYVKPKT